MGFRFRKSLKVAPGVRLNLSKSGVSATLGVPGSNVNIGRNSRVTVGVPGSGLSYQSSLRAASGTSSSRPSGLGVVTMGIAPVLNDEPSFDDSAARSLCETAAAAGAKESVGQKAVWGAAVVGALLGVGVSALWATGVARAPMSTYATVHLAIWGAVLSAMAGHALVKPVLVRRRARQLAETAWPVFERDARGEHAKAVEHWRSMARADVTAEEVAAEAGRRLEAMEWPFDVSCHFHIEERERALVLVDLPEIEGILEDVSPRAFQQELYAKVVVQVCFTVAVGIMGSSTHMQEVAVAAYTQR